MEEVQIRGPHFISTLPADIKPVEDDNKSKIKKALIVLGLVLLVGVPSVLSFYVPKHIIKASQEIIMAPFAVKTQHGEQFGNVSLSKNPTPTPATIQQQNSSNSSEQNISEYTGQPASYYPASEVQQVIQPQGTQETQNTQYMPFSEPQHQEPNTQNTNQIQEFIFSFFQNESQNQEPDPTSTPVPYKLDPTPTRKPTPTKTPTPTDDPRFVDGVYQPPIEACKGKKKNNSCSYYALGNHKVYGHCEDDGNYLFCQQDQF